MNILQNKNKKTDNTRKTNELQQKQKKPDDLKIVLIAGKQVARSKIKDNIIRQ